MTTKEVVKVHMGRSILTGDNIDGIGAALSKRLAALGFDVHCCGNSFPALAEECRDIAPDGLLFFLYRESDELYRFAEKMTREFPDTELFAISYFRSLSVKLKLRECGVNHFIVMPATLCELSCYIYEVLIPKDDRLFLTDVITFVEAKGMQRFTQGFLYLCLAIEVCIEKPEILSDITGSLYPYIAKKMNTTAANVERALRHFSDMAAARNVVFDDYSGKLPMKNSELIKSAAREFYREHRSDKEEK